jgi:hypothetical protein
MFSLARFVLAALTPKSSKKGRRASAEFKEMLSIRNEKAVALRSGSPGHPGPFVQRLRFAEREAQPLQTLAFSARS